MDIKTIKAHTNVINKIHTNIHYIQPLLVSFIMICSKLMRQCVLLKAN